MKFAKVMFSQVFVCPLGVGGILSKGIPVQGSLSSRGFLFMGVSVMETPHYGNVRGGTHPTNSKSPAGSEKESIPIGFPHANHTCFIMNENGHVGRGSVYSEVQVEQV